MSDKYAVVITTINKPTRAVIEIAAAADKLSADFILIGDEKSPADFKQENSVYLDIAAQIATGFEYAKIAPTRHYARKNIGYLEAIRRGATILVETDDDNIPFDAFWETRSPQVSAPVLRDDRWINTYAYFHKPTQGIPLWPRGLPLDRILDQQPSLEGHEVETVHCPVQQALADDNPDVDAIYRLVGVLPVIFDKSQPVILADAAWCPFNSQNTTWWREAFPLLYLPYYCSFRMTDIWRSFVTQRILFLNGWGLSFHQATVFQERNEHNLMRDFEEEIPGYLNNQKIRDELMSLDLRPGVENIPESLVKCYEKLIELKFVGEGEMPLLKAWLEDIAVA